jgi:diphthine methyl ester acylhydrolase
MTNITSIQSLTTELPPSCIAFVPARPEYFVIGTYFLHPKDHPTTQPGAVQDDLDSNTEHGSDEQRRSGSLILCRLANDDMSEQ